jgi:nondiscriminating aspartyl-tRNA synthetase
MTSLQRTFICSLHPTLETPVLLRGWIYRLRELARTTFILLRDCTGEIQCVVDSASLRLIGLKLDEPIEIKGRVRADTRAYGGFEVDVIELSVLNSVARPLPFNASSNLKEIGTETILSYRPLSLRNESIGDIFRIQAAILHCFRQFLRSRHFTEIVTSKLVSSGTEGGTNLFEVKYFDRLVYLAQSPQFYKEYGVAGFERVFETGNVYRAEPHASSRHLTEYYSLDLEMGFIDSPETVIQLERELLTYVFECLNQEHGNLLQRYRETLLPSMLNVPTWEFEDCLERLKHHFNRMDLVDDLDPNAERQLCELAKQETGIPAVFVLGFPLTGRPFYTHPRDNDGSSDSFDLLFEGIEITTGGRRLHRRIDLEKALMQREIDPNLFDAHLQVFDMGMPPHGGLAIGLERLTARILHLANVRQATLYPRDRYRVSP